jgi:two-component system response regulator AtoC
MACKVQMPSLQVQNSNMPSAKQRKSTLIEPIDTLPPDEVLFGHSVAMMEVRQRATKVCNANVPVLLYGNGGTGKEAVARWIHEHSSKRNGEFVKVNCAAIPGSLLESELFGYEKGAFTGAHTSKPGRVEFAHNGTLFLDEIADLDLALQSKLLQFLQDGCFSRIGDQTERVVETRLICATNRDLESEIHSGTFRGDLFYRINVICLQLPPLRERREDIPAVAEYFRTQFQKKFTKQSEPLSNEILQYLQNLDWPGNIRELSNVIARHVLIGAEGEIFQEPIAKQPDPARGSSRGVGAVPLKQIAKEVVRERERGFILEALKANQWNRRKAAQELKISYRTLIYKIRDAGLISRRVEHVASRQDEQAGSSALSAD